MLVSVAQFLCFSHLRKNENSELTSRLSTIALCQYKKKLQIKWLDYVNFHQNNLSGVIGEIGWVFR